MQVLAAQSTWIYQFGGSQPTLRWTQYHEELLNADSPVKNICVYYGLVC